MTVRKKKPAKRAGRATASGQVQLIVNGQASGTVAAGTQSISEAANVLARGHGIKSYSILLDGGMRVGTEEAGQPLAGHSSLEIFAKETRG